MRYPAMMRDLMRFIGFQVGITGKIGLVRGRKLDILSVFEVIFKEKDRAIRTVKIDSTEIHVDLSHRKEKLLYYVPYNMINTYLHSDLYCLMKIMPLNEGDIFVDIGANLGMYSYLSHRRGMKTVLFEPEPVHYAFLERNPHIFNFAYDCALSNTSGKFDFFVAGDCKPGASSLINSQEAWKKAVYKETIQISVNTFDQVLEEDDFDSKKIKLIKIDVEGNEYNTVQGMTQYLNREHTGIIWCEVRGIHSDRGSNSCNNVVNFLSNFKYSPYILKNNRIYEFDIRQSNTLQVFDILFVKPDHCWLLENFKSAQ